MKTITKLATAALFALSAAAPALATDPTALQLEERNTFINRQVAPVAQQARAQVQTHHAFDAMAHVRAQDVYAQDGYVKNQNSMF